MVWWWSYVLAAGGAFGYLLLRRGLWQGFAVSVGMQALWLAYAVLTRQWGFLMSVALFGSMSGWGWYTWQRHGVPGGGRVCRCPCACGARPGAPRTES